LAVNDFSEVEATTTKTVESSGKISYGGFIASIDAIELYLRALLTNRLEILRFLAE